MRADALRLSPFGSRRVLALIHWQALKLWPKRVPFFKTGKELRERLNTRNG